jgi:hypothetical protein
MINDIFARQHCLAQLMPPHQKRLSEHRGVHIVAKPRRAEGLLAARGRKAARKLPIKPPARGSISAPHRPPFAMPRQLRADVAFRRGVQLAPGATCDERRECKPSIRPSASPRRTPLLGARGHLVSGRRGGARVPLRGCAGEQLQAARRLGDAGQRLLQLLLLGGIARAAAQRPGGGRQRRQALLGLRGAWIDGRREAPSSALGPGVGAAAPARLASARPARTAYG